MREFIGLVTLFTLICHLCCKDLQMFRRNKRVSDSIGNSSFFTSESEIPISKDSQIIFKLYHVILIIYIRFMLSRRTVTAVLSTDTYRLNCRNPSVLLIPGSSSPPALLTGWPCAVTGLPSPASAIIYSRSLSNLDVQ